MDFNNSQRLICVEYPGRVVNSDKAIETLGGICQISQTLSNEKARLSLTFRPNNLYSKGMQGDRVKNAGVLLKVKIKRRGNEVLTESVEVVGHSDLSYRFESMCDYEMLPLMKRTPDAAAADLFYNDLIPSIDSTMDEWLQNPNPMPYFFPPQTFTKFDSSITDRRLFKAEERGSRVKRHYREVVRVDFNLTDPVPTKPAFDWTRKQVTAEDIEAVREHFKERPVWNRLGLIATMGTVSLMKMKYILPFVAYFQTNGPWRNTWLRYGYDPRQDFDSRRYQMMDLRLNKRAVINIKSRLERNKEASYPVKQLKKNVISQLVFDENAGAEEERELYNPVFAQRNFHHLVWVNFFQYCDIEVPKIQEMLEKVPNPMNGAKLSEKSGWLPAGFDEQCREILLEILREHYQIEMGKGNEEGEEDNTEMMAEGEEEDDEEMMDDEEYEQE